LKKAKEIKLIDVLNKELERIKKDKDRVSKHKVYNDFECININYIINNINK